MADKKISQLTAANTPLAGTEVLPIVQGGSTVKVSVANLTAGRTVNASEVVVASSTYAYPLLINVTAGSTAGVEFRDPTTTTNPVIGSRGNNLAVEAGGNEVIRFGSNNNITVNTGNLVIGTAGKGIDFSANTHAAGMTSELLNDYEEGTWTPNYYGATGSAGSLAYAEQSGKYTKIGRQVTVTGTIILSNKGSWTGRIQIGGFPFVSLADQFTGNVELRNCTFTGNNVIIEIGRAGSDFARFVIVNGLGANSQLDDTMVANNSGFLFTLTYFV